MPELNTPTMPDNIISVEGVAKLLHDLNPSKASGPDNISARILKLTAEEIASVLSIIFQKSLDTGEIPLSWLRANITPLFLKKESVLVLQTTIQFRLLVFVQNCLSTFFIPTLCLILINFPY